MKKIKRDVGASPEEIDRLADQVKRLGEGHQ